MNKNICVFCSSSNTIAENYKQAAFRLGEAIAKNGDTLVYGGATGGLMTSVAEGANAQNGKITGVITGSIIRMGRLSPLLSETIKVDSLSERKQRMRALADIFIVLPGGFGTLDEMFDVVASGTIGEHKKPLIIVNEDGFFDQLLEQIETFRKQNCMPRQESYKC